MVGIDLRFRIAVGVAAVELDIDPRGKRTARPGAYGLEDVDAALVVRAVEEVGLGLAAYGITVVDDVLAGIVVEVDAAVGARVMVLKGQPGHHSGDVCGTFEHGPFLRSGVLGVCLHDVEIPGQAPLGRELIGGLNHPAGGAEGRILAMAGGAVVAHIGGNGEAAVGILLGHASAPGPVGSAHQLDIHAVAQEIGLAGDNVDGTAHRVGAVEDGGRAARHLHALGQVGEVLICHRVAVDGHILRVPVYQDQRPAAGGTEAAQGDAAGRTGGHSVAGNPA